MAVDRPRGRFAGDCGAADEAAARGSGPFAFDFDFGLTPAATIASAAAAVGRLAIRFLFFSPLAVPGIPLPAFTDGFFFFALAAVAVAGGEDDAREFFLGEEEASTSVLPVFNLFVCVEALSTAGERALLAGLRVPRRIAVSVSSPGSE